MKPNKRPNAQQRAERDRQAAELRIAGVDYDTIAQRLGYASRGHAYDCIQSFLQRHAEQTVPVARDIELTRLDRLMLAHWKKATQGDTQSTAIILKIMERRAKLAGLDAPIKQEVTGDGSLKIEVTYIDPAPPASEPSDDPEPPSAV